MSKAEGDATRGVSDDALRGAIASTLGDGQKVVGLQRHHSAYATSCPLEEVEAELSDGTTRRLMLKHLGLAVRHQRALRAKPLFLVDPEREIVVYREILAPRRLGATLVGTSPPGCSSPWLMIEKAAGVEMYQIGDLDAWRAAAQWIASLHQAVPAEEARALAAAPRLIAFDRNFGVQWMDRALYFFANEEPTSRHGRSALYWLAKKFEQVVDRLLASQSSFIHGEFYASNVLAAHGGDQGWHVCPVDWEMAAIGPAVLDLAALTSGDWSDAARTSIIDAYIAACDSRHVFDDVRKTVGYAQLYLSVQWLGWFGRRHAPRDHARDWLADAVEHAERLNL